MTIQKDSTGTCQNNKILQVHDNTTRFYNRYDNTIRFYRFMTIQKDSTGT